MFNLINVVIVCPLRGKKRTTKYCFKSWSSQIWSRQSHEGHIQILGIANINSTQSGKFIFRTLIGLNLT